MLGFWATNIACPKTNLLPYFFSISEFSSVFNTQFLENRNVIKGIRHCTRLYQMRNSAARLIYDVLGKPRDSSYTSITKFVIQTKQKMVEFVVPELLQISKAELGAKHFIC